MEKTTKLNKGLLKLRAWSHELKRFVYATDLTFGEGGVFIRFVESDIGVEDWQVDPSIGLMDNKVEVIGNIYETPHLRNG